MLLELLSGLAAALLLLAFGWIFVVIIFPATKRRIFGDKK